MSAIHFPLHQLGGIFSASKFRTNKSAKPPTLTKFARDRPTGPNSASVMPAGRERFSAPPQLGSPNGPDFKLILSHGASGRLFHPGRLQSLGDGGHPAALETRDVNIVGGGRRRLIV